MDFDMVTSRGVPSSEAAVSSAAPKSFQNRTLSESSEASDGRRLGTSILGEVRNVEISAEGYSADSM